jgi:hypothetical protein
MLDMLQNAIDEGVANVLFGILFFVAVAILIICALFVALAIRELWRWITRGSWNRIIVKTERKAIR